MEPVSFRRGAGSLHFCHVVCAGITYRYSIWLQRPPTALFWKRGWQVFFKRKHRAHNVRIWFKRVVGEFALNDFIWKRDPIRGLTHSLLMWGCILAAVITFPLVFGWPSFESLPERIDRYRRILPLILLFSVSLTGLLLTVSSTWLKGYACDFLALAHAVTVIFTLLWLPFGKFFHIFQRPAQLGVELYKDVAAREETAACRRCGHPFASKMHVIDLIEVERALGYSYEVDEPRVEHYQWICPPCRRAMFALAQGGLKAAEEPRDLRQGRPATPSYANPGLGEGPLGVEDRENYHA
jgi:hypothetical protein